MRLEIEVDNVVIFRTCFKHAVEELDIPDVRTTQPPNTGLFQSKNHTIPVRKTVLEHCRVRPKLGEKRVPEERKSASERD